MNEIKPELTNTTTGIIIGQADAPVKIIEFTNLRCPFCKQWWDERNDLLNQYVAEHKLQRIIKLFDKEKESLRPGNVMHHHVPKEPDAALSAIDAIFDTQNQWGTLQTLDDIAKFAETELHLTLQDYEQTAQSVIDEADAAGIRFIPTMVINGHVFDQKISAAELIALLEGR
ncbi:thioredoxin domain-containing protein [Vagococcus acidifermentans]|uniref:Thioredoxin n=1 Tax=Vagococcus acidifermentans TaxID=564710 RepID=A0A430AS24_9ENTE|nr:thioredoxin domain-containing protein [Vagococcus acidifermentans]RSU10861.1 thioredoxin [Vagococcus acidifermentans]